jgi:hypothetical protein
VRADFHQVQPAVSLFPAAVQIGSNFSFTPVLLLPKLAGHIVFADLFALALQGLRLARGNLSFLPLVLHANAATL